MPAYHDCPTPNDDGLSQHRRSAAPNSERLSVTPSVGQERPRLPRFLPASGRDHCRSRAGDGGHRDAMLGGEVATSPAGVPRAYGGAAAATAAPSRFGRTRVVAVEFAEEEAVKGSWTCSPIDREEAASVLSRRIAGAPAIMVVGALLLVAGIGGGVALSDRTASSTTRVAEAVTGAVAPPSERASPLEQPPSDAVGVGGPIDGALAVMDPSSVPTIGARSVIAAMVVGHLRQPRTSVGLGRPTVAAPPTQPSQPALRSEQTGSDPGRPTADPAAAPRSDTTTAAGTGAVPLPESAAVEAILRPTVTPPPPPAQLAALLREAEDDARRLARRMAASSMDRNYRIQLGLFVEMRNAEQYGNQLPEDVLILANDTHYSIDETIIDDVKYQRLHVGNFGDLHSTMASCDAIRKMGVDCYVIY